MRFRCVAVVPCLLMVSSCQRCQGAHLETDGAPATSSAGGHGAVVASAGGSSAPPLDAPGSPTLVDGDEARILLKGILITPSGPIAGELLVVGNTIACVERSCASRSERAGATVIETGGIVFPGLIDAHNHGLFNIFDESDWKPVKLYKNHNLWTSDARYKQVVDAKQYLESSSGGKLRCELNKYAETKALIAGTTSIVIAAGAQQPSCTSSLARTVDTIRSGLPEDKLQSSIAVPSEAAAARVCQRMGNDKVDAYVVHDGEGIDETARKEFDTLGKRAGGCLLSPHTTIVHGTAFQEEEFRAMAEKGMALVWSPKSNVFLYGDTARIDLALRAGVQRIALAPDWALGGSVNLLDELRFADRIDGEKFGDILTPERLVSMVTIDAARALGVDRYIGSLEPGKRADLMVIPRGVRDPYRALLDATPVTVRLVMVEGRVLYGDPALSAAGPAVPGCEELVICQQKKFLCAAEAASHDKLDQTLVQLRDALSAELAKYDARHATEPPLSPIAPLARCGT